MKNGGPHCSLVFFRNIIYRRDTGIAHSVIFLLKLCAVRIILFQTFMKIFVIFLIFGYYLKRKDFVAALVGTISNMHTNEKKTGFRNLSQGGKGPSQEVV